MICLTTRSETRSCSTVFPMTRGAGHSRVCDTALQEAVWRMWSELRNFNQHLNDELGDALFEYFFLKLPHHRFNSLLHLWPTNIDDGAFLEARLFEKLCSAQLLSPLGSISFQSTQASCVFHRLRLEKGWCDTPHGGNHWQAQWMEPPVWVLAWEGAQKKKKKGLHTGQTPPAADHKTTVHGSPVFVNVA